MNLDKEIRCEDLGAVRRIGQIVPKPLQSDKQCENCGSGVWLYLFMNQSSSLLCGVVEYTSQQARQNFQRSDLARQAQDIRNEMDRNRPGLDTDRHRLERNECTSNEFEYFD